MRGYADVYGARSTVLLYPLMSDLMASSGPQAEWIFAGGDSRLKVVAVDVALNDMAAENLLSAIDLETYAP